MFRDTSVVSFVEARTRLGRAMSQRVARRAKSVTVWRSVKPEQIRLAVAFHEPVDPPRAAWADEFGGMDVHLFTADPTIPDTDTGTPVYCRVVPESCRWAPNDREFVLELAAAEERIPRSVRIMRVLRDQVRGSGAIIPVDTVALFLPYTRARLDLRN